MPLATFDPTPPPSPGTNTKPEIKTLLAEFGDGYTQETPDGLNHIRRITTLSWELLTPAQKTDIENFFIAQKGTMPFWYTPSNELVAVKWTCKDWNHQIGQGGYYMFTATLRQSFNPAT